MADLFVVGGSSYGLALLQSELMPCVDGLVVCGRSIASAFPDGEWRMRVGSPNCLAPASRRAVILHEDQSLCLRPNDWLVALLLAVKACRSAGYDEVICVAPWFRYVRQDRVGERGEAATCAHLGELLRAAGLDAVVTWHLARPERVREQWPEGLKLVDCAVPERLSWVVGLSGSDCVVAPDAGGRRLAEGVAALAEVTTVLLPKTRVSPTSVVRGNIPSFGGANGLLIIDDLAWTGATLASAVEQIRSTGFAGPVSALVSHIPRVEVLSELILRLVRDGLLQRVWTSTSFGCRGFRDEHVSEFGVQQTLLESALSLEL